MNYNMEAPRVNIKLTKLILTEARSYKDNWIRPYEMNVGYDDLNKVQNIVEKSLSMTTRNAIDGMISGEMPSVVTPSGIVLNKAPIINGWAEKRFKFVMLVEINTPGSPNVEINYIQGYTSHLGVSPSGHIDPNMIFYPNTVTVLDRVFDPNMNTYFTRPKYSYNIVKDETNMINDDFTSYKLARPSDVTSNISMLNDMEGVEMHTNVASINHLEMVDRKQVLPTDHLATIIKTVTESKVVTGVYSDNENTLDLAIGNLLPSSPFMIGFFKYLLNHTGREDTSFSTSLLYSMFPEAEHIGQTFLSSGIEIIKDLPPELATEDTAETYDNSFETRMSLVIHEAVSTLLSNSLLSEIVFEADNLTGLGTGNILNLKSYIPNLNLPLAGNTFITGFLNKVWNTITNNNSNAVSILVHGSLESDMTISIQADGRYKMIYRYPTFANSKFLPVIMDNDRLNAMSEGYKNLIDTTLETAQNVIVRSTAGQAIY